MYSIGTSILIYNKQIPRDTEMPNCTAFNCSNRTVDLSKTGEKLSFYKFPDPT